MQDFPKNSFEKQPPQQNKKVIQPVTTNVTEVKKKKFFNFKGKILSTDADSVGAFVVSEVILPKIKDMISGAVKYSIDFILYGKNGASVGGNRSGAGIINYNSQYRSSLYQPSVPINMQQSGYNRPVVNTIYQVRDFVFGSRGEAETVAIALQDNIARYGSVSVNDFYDLIGQNGQYTDQKYGWYDLAGMEVNAVPGGYIINLPKVVPLTQQ